MVLVINALINMGSINYQLYPTVELKIGHLVKNDLQIMTIINVIYQVQDLIIHVIIIIVKVIYFPHLKMVEHLNMLKIQLFVIEQ